jgi:hypothetical protein
MAAEFAVRNSWLNTTDRTARTEAARRGMTKRFERQVDPDGVLANDELAKRVENARRAHMLGMRLKSAKARRLRKEAALIEAELAAEDEVTGGAAERADGDGS